MTNLTATQALQRGVEAHNEGKLYEAERFYRAILKSQPKNLRNDHDISVVAQTYSYLGLALRDKGDLKAYINCLQEAVKIKPDDADTLNNLGAALQHNGELEAAIGSYKQALKVSPACAEAYNNMGSALQAKGDLDAAIDSYREALKIKPDYANAYDNMGHALHDKGDLEASIDCYKSALEIMPGSTQAHNNMGNALREVGRNEEALTHFDFITSSEANPNNPQFWFNSQSQALECLYILGRYSELEERLKALADSGDINLRLAGVSAFVTHQLKLEDPYPFCKKPLDFVQVGNLNDHITDVSGFIEDLTLEASKVAQVWEPQHGVTKFGFQTSPTIFGAGKNCEALEKILRKEIDSYYSNFRSEDCALIDLWPGEFDLRGWFVRLIKNGHQRPHNHPSGWLSGVVYLKTIDSLDADDGAIEFSLHGHDLPILDSSYARKIHRPKRGDVVLFPSSLFHRTIPFKQDTDRNVIAFDLYRYPY